MVAWFVVKPVRLLAPEFAGLECFDQGTCLDGGSYDEALQLRSDAMAFLSANVGALDAVPTVVFCSTWNCAEKFGLGERSAVTMGTFGAVIGPRGWTPYYVRRELIHQL